MGDDEIEGIFRRAFDKLPCMFQIGSDKMSIQAKNRIVGSTIYSIVFYFVQESNMTLTSIRMKF